VIHVSGNLSLTFNLNYSEFPNSCPFWNLFLFKDSLQMLVNCGDANLKEFSHQLLGQPDALILKSTLNPRPPILGLIEEDLPSGRNCLRRFFGTSHGEKLRDCPTSDEQGMGRG